ncbi:hypothetical protein [Lyticum sinuosum]|uniref:Uncharacterized protein n=1 Tax=Lyticum sinuosum TaxID=1332059 RepID=A0AAE5AH24_9RICK|nr:hypothetical protein [Lyticum sinuosum]MDZ5761492.1 hypothetical protein [Lyticum sinuosum]
MQNQEESYEKSILEACLKLNPDLNTDDDKPVKDFISKINDLNEKNKYNTIKSPQVAEALKAVQWIFFDRILTEKDQQKENELRTQLKTILTNKNYQSLLEEINKKDKGIISDEVQEFAKLSGELTGADLKIENGNIIPVIYEKDQDKINNDDFIDSNIKTFKRQKEKIQKCAEILVTKDNEFIYLGQKTDNLGNLANSPDFTRFITPFMIFAQKNRPNLNLDILKEDKITVFADKISMFNRIKINTARFLILTAMVATPILVFNIVPALAAIVAPINPVIAIGIGILIASAIISYKKNANIKIEGGDAPKIESSLITQIVRESIIGILEAIGIKYNAVISKSSEEFIKEAFVKQRQKNGEKTKKKSIKNNTKNFKEKIAKFEQSLDNKGIIGFGGQNNVRLKHKKSTDNQKKSFKMIIKEKTNEINPGITK